jgi:hypothetical protein
MRKNGIGVIFLKVIYLPFGLCHKFASRCLNALLQLQQQLADSLSALNVSMSSLCILQLVGLIDLDVKLVVSQELEQFAPPFIFFFLSGNISVQPRSHELDALFTKDSDTNLHNGIFNTYYDGY